MLDEGDLEGELLDDGETLALILELLLELPEGLIEELADDEFDELGLVLFEDDCETLALFDEEFDELLEDDAEGETDDETDELTEGELLEEPTLISGNSNSIKLTSIISAAPAFVTIRTRKSA